MHDITRPLHERMLMYPGNPPVKFRTLRQASASSSALISLALGSHTGTHIDAPAHVIPGGVGTASYSLEQMIGACEVIDLSAVANVINDSDLPATTQPRLLLKTKNSSGSIDVFNENFVALAESAATLLIERGIKLIGIDAPSIKKRGVSDNVHHLLLQAGIVILEGLWLKDVAAGYYELLCLPLAVDLDGAPVRAALRPLD